MIDRNLVLGFGVGIVAGIVGYKLYSKNKASIDATLANLAAPQGAKAPESPVQDASVAEAGDFSLEELETQKERLEDLIAECQAKLAAKNANDTASAPKEA